MATALGKTYDKMSSANVIIEQKSFEMVECLLGQMVISNSIDSCVKEKDDATHEAGVMNKIDASGIPPHELDLKPSECTIWKDSQHQHGHCNGQDT